MFLISAVSLVFHLSIHLNYVIYTVTKMVAKISSNLKNGQFWCNSGQNSVRQISIEHNEYQNLYYHLTQHSQRTLLDGCAGEKHP